ncbi:hypothetical protein KIN20_022503 [Parelaphostrongylus tenuis]|uniref:Uncharacterized protein n=1 Tax=Parelaphostrongylus tenuis TaxID=148309 RepID=A0AAD5QSA9_PARTN|nr:hypothetical protein KIN20_022503 [Parelaphostrongylus tenuis]
MLANRHPVFQVWLTVDPEEAVYWIGGNRLIPPFSDGTRSIVQHNSPKDVSAGPFPPFPPPPLPRPPPLTSGIDRFEYLSDQPTRHSAAGRRS